jgi:hypothetical protein
MQRAMSMIVLALASSLAGAQEIYKCTTDAGVGYQSIPCGAGQTQARLFVGPIVPGPQADSQPAPVTRLSPAPRRPTPWRNRTLVLGMSDDEVLNMPAWGRPSHIARTRIGREWQEVWTYGGPGGERELRFVNARLAEIAEVRPQVALLTLR